MTESRAFREASPTRGNGTGLLSVVGLIFAGTFWTVGSFVESNSLVTAATRAPVPMSTPVAECPGCDCQTLTPTPAWQMERMTPDAFLRAASARAVPASQRTAVRPAGAGRAGTARPYWARVSAPVACDANG